MARKTQKVIVSLWMHACAGRRHLAGVCRYIATGHNWDIILCRNGQILPEMLADADGVIIATSAKNGLLTTLRRRRIPAVIIDLSTDDVPDKGPLVSRVFSDDQSVGEAMARHVLSYGNFRMYGFVSDNTTRWAIERRSGFVETIQAMRKPVRQLALMPKTERKERESSIVAWLRALPKPSAVMAATDELAIELLTVARQAKIRIPHDLAVVGTDDDELLCEYATPKLTSIRPGHEACGYAAAEELDLLMRGKPPRTRLVPFETITDRKSLAPCIPAAHLVEAANDYIVRHACEGKGVDDVAAALGVSRRLLSLRYAEFEGRSVHEALVGRRLEEVKRLLIKTDAPIAAITARCGFANANYLKRLFKRRTGQTMREWRCGGRP